ncbi:hypothetical protein JMA_15700 [Jeotgalibacillus malaysiensis]|uniref:Uncharacterized protein n=1 Tax=Jeotgalibacillus malaysiensis TaxID=1508404 RepID=A0A0B5AQG2_9BACL|nr:hypothetical protein [Jeotgalibacillus malaysiensis]AJD90887.1 hypothetical protein JMA_15700 [Jeotgalibacillus malaysiensis]
MHIAAIVIVLLLVIIYFLPGSKNETKVNDEGWLVAAIVTALVTYGLIELAKEDEMKEMSLQELKDTLEKNGDLPDLEQIVHEMGTENLMPDLPDSG